jgi:hypothetical protein
MGAATEPLESIVARLPEGHPLRVIPAYLQGDAAFSPTDPLLRYAYPTELAERRFILAADRRAEIPRVVLDEGLDKAVRLKVPLLEAAVRRARGLALRDEAELTAAIAIWEPRSALPGLGRARAERGLIRGDSVETEAGLGLLKKVGDVNYLDRFAARV